MITQTKLRASIHTLWQSGVGVAVVATIEHYTKILEQLPTTEMQAGVTILAVGLLSAAASGIKSSLVR